jgi:RNA polymerase sigma factor (sigma-70 family)
MNNTLAHRIEKLEPRLRKLASSLARDAFQADDMFQQACIRILNTCQPDDPENVLYKRARSAMMHVLTLEAIYNKVVGTEDNLTASGDPEDEDAIVWEYFEADQVSPEQELIEHEELAGIFAAIKQLSPENQTVVKMLAVGKSQAEIAKELGCSRSAMSQRMTGIARKLTSFGFCPA